MSDDNLEQPHALPHVPSETVYLTPTPSELAPASLLAVIAAMGDLTAIAARLKTGRAMAAYYETNRLWFELDKERMRLERATANG